MSSGTGRSPTRAFTARRASRRSRASPEKVGALGGRAPFGQLRDLVRKVRPDCAIDLDTNGYSVPWRLAGETVQVVVLAGRAIVRHAGAVVPNIRCARGAVSGIAEMAHLSGLVGSGAFSPEPPPSPALLRPLAEYEAPVGGAGDGAGRP